MKRREFLKSVAGTGAGALLAGCTPSRTAPPNRPNVIFIFADQLRADICGVYGGRNIETPHIDRLAREGVTFEHGLSTCPLCTPYRGMLMTGRYPTHSGLVLTWLDASPEQNPQCLGNVFAAAGYETGFIGKWHLTAGHLREAGKVQLEPFVIDKHHLRTAAYTSRGRWPNAILCLLANHEPRGWKDQDHSVLNEVYYELREKPNLHHIFPVNYVKQNPGSNRLNVDSMMNIAYLIQEDHKGISDKSPLEYLKKFDSSGFEGVLDTHLIPLDILNWARRDRMPGNALDVFIKKRIGLIVEDLRQKLTGVDFDVIDSKGKGV